MKTSNQPSNIAYARHGMRARYRLHPQSYAGAAAFLLAIIVAGVFPLFFNDQFFDINRAKLALFEYSAGIGAAACLVLFLMEHAVRKDFRQVCLPRVTLADVGITLFALCALCSTLYSTHPQQALTGEGGRRSGLLFIGALYLMYLVLSRALRMRPLLLYVYLAAGTVVAILGVLNFYMVDPLGFYQNMKDSQTIIFISTIGNINFFGIYLCMVLCVAAALFLNVEKLWAMVLAGACAFACFYGTIASRSDGAILGVGLLFVLLLISSMRDTRSFLRVTVLLGLYMASLLCVHVVGICTNWYGYAFQGGLCERIVKSTLPAYGMVAAMILCLVAWVLHKSGRDLPTHALRRGIWGVLGALAVIILGLVVYCTWANPTLELGAFTQFLRFDNAWGTYRGFVWTRSLQAYAQLDPLRKLIGTGPDTMRYVLEPFRDPVIEAAANGVFENSHNEYLQYLVTLGFVGFAGYLLFMAGAIKNAFVQRRSFAGLALLLMLCVYAPLALVNVNQPVSVVQCFLAASLAASLAREGSKPCAEGGDARESGSAA